MRATMGHLMGLRQVPHKSLFEARNGPAPLINHN